MRFQKEHWELSAFHCFIISSQSFDHKQLWSPFLVLQARQPEIKTAVPLLWETGSWASWKRFGLLLGQLAIFMFPTECHSVLSEAWFCELTFDRHLLYLTCQLRSGLPHLQRVAYKHRQTLRAKKSPTEHMAPLPSSPLLLCLSDVLSGVDFLVCLCVSL